MTVPRRGVAALLTAIAALVVIAMAAVAAPAGTMAGRLVDSATGKGAGSVTVMVYEVPPISPVASVVSRPGGRFRLGGLTGEEYAVRFLGRGDYENGWLSCPPYRVVPTYGEACTHAPADVGPILIDPR